MTDTNDAYDKTHSEIVDVVDAALEMVGVELEAWQLGFIAHRIARDYMSGKENKHADEINTLNKIIETQNQQIEKENITYKHDAETESRLKNQIENLKREKAELEHRINMHRFIIKRLAEKRSEKDNNEPFKIK
jgi:hypothetical protein